MLNTPSPINPHEQSGQNRQHHAETLSSPYSGLCCPGMISISEDRFKGLSEAKDLALKLSAHAPNRSMTMMGLIEIFINAVEHGNLGIEYNMKSAFTSEKQWFEEVNARLIDKSNIHKYVKVITEITPGYIRYTITDQGQGFDWQKYQSMKAVPLTDKNGRGILISKEAAFDKLVYYPPGNIVDCIIYK